MKAVTVVSSSSPSRNRESIALICCFSLFIIEHAHVRRVPPSPCLLTYSLMFSNSIQSLLFFFTKHAVCRFDQNNDTLL